MKIKTITCHDVYNYGASLQAYALMSYLKQLGHDVEIIDYKPDYLNNHYKLKVVNPVYDKPIIKQLYLLAKLIPHLRSLKRKKLFDTFKHNYLKITSICYANNEELKKNLPDADLYIAGSDQIWNTLFNNGRDPAFYLDFAPKDKLKVSYAASMATSKIAPGFENFVYSMVKRLDYIGVRERSAAEILNKLDITNVHVVCDPVFLLTMQQWKSFINVNKPIYTKPYILVYDFDHSKSIYDISCFLAHSENLKVIAIGLTKFGKLADQSIKTGPIEFLNLIYHARYVISNSFHATAFALLFHKEFYVVRREESRVERMVNLLEDLDLRTRLVSSVSELTKKNIDYTHVQELLNNTIQRSKDYITLFTTR